METPPHLLPPRRTRPGPRPTARQAALLRPSAGPVLPPANRHASVKQCGAVRGRGGWSARVWRVFRTNGRQCAWCLGGDRGICRGDGGGAGEGGEEGEGEEEGGEVVFEGVIGVELGIGIGELGSGWFLVWV